MWRVSARRKALLALGLLLAYLLQHHHQEQQQHHHHHHQQQQQSSARSVQQASFRPAGWTPDAAVRSSSAALQQHALRRGLPQGELLREGEYLVSPHGRFFLALEGGVAVARKGMPSDAAPGPALWDTTQGPARPLRRGAHALAVQADGAAAVITDGGTAGQSLVWSSPTATSVKVTAVPTRYELRLEDGGGGGSDGSAWSAAVYSVPTAADGARDRPSAPAVLVKRLFSLPLDELNLSERARPQDPRSPGRACFRNAKRGECTRHQDANLCADVEQCVSRNLWDAQALCSLRSDCRGVARLPSSLPSDGSSPHAQPKYSFVLCGGSAPAAEDTAAAVDTGHAWMKTSCDADSDCAELLASINLVMTVKTSGKVHSTRVQ